MADEEHARLLKGGVAGWNNWRGGSLKLIPDLIEADLRRMELMGAQLMFGKLMRANLGGSNLAGANLARADLTGANLQGAILKKAALWDANLSGSNLAGANLEEANLSGANLEGADLTGSILEETSFEGANLRGVNFSDVRIRKANLAGANLENADLSREFSKAELSGSINFAGANLREAKLWEADLRYKNFIGADLRQAYLGGANLTQSDLSDADLRGAQLDKAHLERADFRGADLSGANFSGAHLKDADLREALLVGANLEGAQLIESLIEGADMSKCRVYGISVWGVKGVPKNQTGLVITPDPEVSITVDDLEVAQFIYLLLRREKLRNVIDTITSKAVLILGRFTPERKVILDAMADELRKSNLLPIIFDFERSTARDFTETIKTLASLSLFVIADITNPKSAPLELQATVPDYQIPFVPIIQEGEEPFSMFSDLANTYDWVLKPVIKYSSQEQLINGFKRGIVDRAWKRHQELNKKKSEKIEILSIDEYLANN